MHRKQLEEKGSEGKWHLFSVGPEDPPQARKVNLLEDGGPDCAEPALRRGETRERLSNLLHSFQTRLQRGDAQVPFVARVREVQQRLFVAVHVPRLALRAVREQRPPASPHEAEHFQI